MSDCVRVDPRLFEAYFDRRPFHLEAPGFVGNPLFELPKLAELAARMPPEYVEYNAGTVGVDQRPELTPQTGLGAEETVRRIEQCNSWMVLKRVDRMPEYAALMDAFLDALEPMARKQVGRTFERQAFLFVSSPGAVTPFHMDPEHNFLLQLRGQKTVHMWTPEDRYVISEQTLERFHSENVHRNLPYEPSFETTAYVLPLRPGQALHFPVTAPHWVQNGPEVSVSLSITFRSEASARRERLYRANAKLRKAGLEPTAPGTHGLKDGAKLLVSDLAKQARRVVGRGGDAAS